MNSFFFFCAKIFWLLFSPDIFIILALLFCLTLFWYGQNKKAMVFLHFIVFCMLVITIVPVGQWLLYPLETRFSIPKTMPEQVDGIIVLGGAENLALTQYWKQPEINHCAERLTAFVHLSRRYPDARSVFTGGIGSMNRNLPTAADVAGLLFQNLGLDKDQIIFEDQSRNTYENGLLTRQKVNPGTGELWVLITSAAHMPRSIGVFNKIGWSVIPYPVDHRVNPDTMFKLDFSFTGHMRDLESALYEWTGLIAYYATEKISVLFPKPFTTQIR